MDFVYRRRVFEVANELGVDVRTVLDALRSLGEAEVRPEAQLSESLARKVRVHLNGGGAVPERRRGVEPARRRSRFAQGIREQHDDAIRRVIPTIAAGLTVAARLPEGNEVIVAFHNRDAVARYGFCTLSGGPLPPTVLNASDARRLLAPLRDVDRDYVARGWTPPNLYIAFDLAHQHVWLGRSLKTIGHPGERLAADSLVRVPPPSAGEPPRINPRAQLFTANKVPSVVAAVGEGSDRPEEAFLLHEELLRLAVDSLVDADVLDPLPVHINAIWFFARPIVMQRAGDSDRHVRAVWYRQGGSMWRIRTYVAGVAGSGAVNVKQVGPQLSGRVPFVPVWDDTRPEQKLLAAVWALMAQGGITESERVTGVVVPSGEPQGELTIVRVQAGSDHVSVYREGSDGEPPDRAAWSVRGHWRRQPYPSLGLDDDGHVRTRLIWIASYVKGSHGAPVEPKVIVVSSRPGEA
ncbi:hypothetical protein ABC304_00540 [Microbacterium sp. 1P10UB]|jgi:hypothetical protein|uniref:hypothetical protein n=1 Tax=Microbacterium TaxID=33882 RepID=UPI000967BBCD|nr:MULTISPECIES: hypothetical protein [Microbacterium]MAB77729.1 hypothetical protein [Planctomycetota bacterium]MAT19489.1 hypothetical protein [Leifsonia sp.]OJV94275.1 MAG: hypothetical protein BGO47_11130 [Microbacterium sp. 67-17]MBN9153917.1 hypothetical protein [Microbacterium sp.]MDX2376199.1 hypothetical protein [Microbacterium sp. LRZ72]|tara:strand:- start:2165 stop:3559 length:1395 start_codon:yes stop_codon:yes gene_type:complete